MSASAIDASHAATVRMTIVKTWPVQLRVKPAEGDERQGGSLEHHLGREEHHDQVAPRQEPQHPEDEEGCAHQQVVSQKIQRKRIGHDLSR